MTSCRELALVYHDLHQIYLVDTEENNRMLGYILGLNAVNLAEAAGGMMKHPQLIDIYVCTALRIKYTCPGLLQGIQRY